MAECEQDNEEWQTTDEWVDFGWADPADCDFLYNKDIKVIRLGRDGGEKDEWRKEER